MSIHQEVSFSCKPAALYKALTDGAAFAKWTGAPAKITKSAGGAFEAFGGKIEGRNIELQPDKRVVQAWRVADWPEGVYSLVRFELKGDGRQTHLTLDQVGHPAEAEPHLTGGWKMMYWDPLQKGL